MLVHPSVPAHSIADLIALAKSEPGKLNFASTGIGTSTHLSAELFAAMADIKLNAIPYKGVGSRAHRSDGGQVPLMFCPTASVIGLVRQGQVRALATTGAKRSPLFPDLPTVAEAGLPGYDAELHYGLVAPAGTAPAIVSKLNAALNDALADPNVKDRLAVDGEVTLPGTPEAYAADIANEQAKWSAIMKKAGVTAE